MDALAVLEQIGTVVTMVVLVVVFVVLWRRYPKHPILLMAICLHRASSGRTRS